CSKARLRPRRPLTGCSTWSRTWSKRCSPASLAIPAKRCGFPSLRRTSPTGAERWTLFPGGGLRPVPDLTAGCPCGSPPFLCATSVTSLEVRVATCRAKTASAARRVVEFIDLVPFGKRDRRQHKLRDPVAARDGERRVAEVDDDHLELAAVIAVDCPRGVGQRDTVLQREARPRPDLDLVTRQDSYRKAGCHRMAAAYGYGDVFGRNDVHACRTVGRIGRQRQSCSVRQALDAHTNPFSHRPAPSRCVRPTDGRPPACSSAPNSPFRLA